ncbi:AAA family ATPase [Rhodopseudomonas palustris]|nr:AAA family ATPase [Rhodopseudomonas palustris]
MTRTNAKANVKRARANVRSRAAVPKKPPHKVASKAGRKPARKGVRRTVAAARPRGPWTTLVQPIEQPEGTSEVAESASSDPPLPRERPTARCALVAAAWTLATTGEIRARLKEGGSLAVVVVVPTSAWVASVKSMFEKRFGRGWEIFSIDDTTAKSPREQAAQNICAANELMKGHAVVGIAAQRDALPPALTTAADITIRIEPLRGSVIRRAIRLFTGLPVGQVEDDIAAGGDFLDLLAAFRSGSTPTDILLRLRRATARSADEGQRLPALESAVEYGAAREWGLALARDIADYRAGRLDWREVDRGAVLHSEPGLGKTLFAQILARACGLPLIATSVADLFASSPGYLDSVIKASRAVFDRAAAAAPCILFLDEIDALPNRATMSPRGADWWTPVITDFLLRLDNAVANQRAGIVVIGATNNIAGVDAAMLRPGRLERSIEILRPDHAGVINILRHHLERDLATAELTDVGHLLDGTTGAEIMMVVRQARRLARHGGRALEVADLLRAVVPIEEIAPDLLFRISAHEAAHAVGTLVLGCGILLRSTVTPRGGRTTMAQDLGVASTRATVESEAVMLLCGRAAERLILGDVSLGSGGTGASDLALATKMVAALHASSGLGETLTYLSSHEDALETLRFDVGLRMRVEREMIAVQERADELVRRHRAAILAVAEQLRARRQLTGTEIRKIVDEVPPTP